MWVWVMFDNKTNNILGIYTFKTAMISQLRNTGAYQRDIRIERWAINNINPKMVDVTNETRKELR